MLYGLTTLSINHLSRDKYENPEELLKANILNVRQYKKST